MNSNVFTLPAFPLNLIVLPGETKVLHIFEERYRQLVNDCLKNNANFCIPFVSKSGMDDFGSSVKISNVLQVFPNGEMDIEITGISTFKIIRFTKQLSPKLYGAASIEESKEVYMSENADLFQQVDRYIHEIKKQRFSLSKNSGVSIYKVALLFDLSNQEKLGLIRLSSLNEKETFLIEKIHFGLRVAQIEKELGERFTLN